MTRDRKAFVTYLADRYPMMTEREADGLCVVCEHLDALLSIPDAAAGLRAWLRVQSVVAYRHALAADSPADFGRAKVLNDLTQDLGRLVSEVRSHEKAFLTPPSPPVDYAALIHEEPK